jgi:hypothetical protein
MFAHQLGDIQVVSRPASRHLRGERQRLAPQHAAHAAEFLGARELIHLEELRDIRLEYLQCGDLHGARAHRFEGHTQRGGVGEDYPGADETYLRFRAGEFQLEAAGAGEFVAAAAADFRFERDDDLAHHVFVHIEREQVVLDTGREFALGQADQPLEILARVDGVRELELDLPLIVDLHRLGLRDGELIQRGHTCGVFTADVDAQRLAVPAQDQLLFLLPANDVRHGELILPFAAQPGDGHRFSRELGRQRLLDLLAVFGVGGVDGAAQGHHFLVAVFHVEAEIADGEVDLQGLHGEFEGLGFRRDAGQALGQHFDAVFGVGRELGFGTDHQFTAAGEGSANLHRRLDDHIGRGVGAHPGFGNHVAREHHAQGRVPRDGAAAVLADGTDPAGVGRPGLGVGRVFGTAAAASKEHDRRR